MITLNSTLQANGKLYKEYVVTIKSTIYSVFISCEMSGKLNYINIYKQTANPFGLGLGKKDYNSFDAAAAAYKLPEIKSALLQIETGII